VSHKPGGRLSLLPPGPQLPSQPLRGLLPVSLLGEQRHNGCVNSLPKTVTRQRRGCDLNPDPSRVVHGSILCDLIQHLGRRKRIDTRRRRLSTDCIGKSARLDNFYRKSEPLTPEGMFSATEITTSSPTYFRKISPHVRASPV